MKTIKLSTVTSFVSTALRSPKLAAEATQAVEITADITKALGCHGAARTAVVRKMVRRLADAKPAASYAAVIHLAEKGLLVDVMKAAFDADKASRIGGKQAWSETAQAAIIRGIRAGVKFRNREVAEMTFLGTLNGGKAETLALWGEVDAILERAGWHVTGFGRGRDVEPSLAIVRTSNDGSLHNSADNESEVTLTKHDDPELVLEFLANAGIDPERAYEYLEEIQLRGSITVRSDLNVTGEHGDISTTAAFAPMDEADKWLRANAGEAEADVLYHRPKDGSALFSLLEDPAVHEDFMQRGAAVWADNLPQLASTYPAIKPKLHDEDGVQYAGRKAVRKLLSAFAIWRVQGDTLVKLDVSNDTGSLTANGNYRPGATTIEVSLRERAAVLYQQADSATTVTSDIERVQRSNELWNIEIPQAEQEFLSDAIRASKLMKNSLLMAGLDIPLDSIAFEQVATALVQLPQQLPEGIISRPVQNAEGNHMKDDSGRLLFWVLPSGDAWTQEGELTEVGKKWARFVLDQRANVREVDAHLEGVKEARNLLDALV